MHGRGFGLMHRRFRVNCWRSELNGRFGVPCRCGGSFRYRRRDGRGFGNCFRFRRDFRNLRGRLFDCLHRNLMMFAGAAGKGVCHFFRSMRRLLGGGGHHLCC